METKNIPKEYRFDASGRKPGRLSGEIAVILMGKDSPDFARNKIAERKIIVSNASKMDISQKKRSSPKYKSFSGYPSGLKIRTAEEVAKKHGYGEILRKAVKGMLPKNKLQDKILKNLEISE
ncbi:50S ribosomal protein L13 [Candidatus Campbellbacteria bacterium CG11_big_fil_rev_8_21_14_0_20_44_21]|uniref:50S ribosomal protein L13 n=1 Tax=Candidatus Campbellbacteria bacterium CG22_combo_CG10-13_8_21_14_all_43_18 TaxID=1974530 RepID=A0A2H0DYT7_9BACT|nr:MAG: 50S ribosomal protein L13 [Candidatus Campbellbacteria bacterium CG22_combo_CG10-13_8_21_14_all_43_18]PIR24442.1 MAG: 50S ribosomal protein L13 [Candidatus Campbellbacteria bacterium CG11_big_fil_rev_8_21_14_0_20_44_21]